jgi:hypothetical protein
VKQPKIESIRAKRSQNSRIHIVLNIPTWCFGGMSAEMHGRRTRRVLKLAFSFPSVGGETGSRNVENFLVSILPPYSLSCKPRSRTHRFGTFLCRCSAREVNLAILIVVLDCGGPQLPAGAAAAAGRAGKWVARWPGQRQTLRLELRVRGRPVLTSWQ